MADAIRDSLRSRLKVALKAGDRDATAAVRMVLAAIDNAEAVDITAGGGNEGPIAGSSRGVGSTEHPRRELTEADLRQILQDQIFGLESDAGHYRKIGQDDVADHLDVQIQVLREIQ